MRMRQSVTLLPDLARPAPPDAPLGKAWHTSYLLPHTLPFTEASLNSPVARQLPKVRSISLRLGLARLLGTKFVCTESSLTYVVRHKAKE